MALRVAAADGDRHPHDIRAVQTTIGRADRATHCECATVVSPPSTPIYLLAMRGRFSCNRCSHPPGRRIGPGTVITLEAPIATPSRYSGFGFGGRYPDLSIAGKPVVLLRSRRR